MSVTAGVPTGSAAGTMSKSQRAYAYLRERIEASPGNRALLEELA